MDTQSLIRFALTALAYILYSFIVVPAIVVGFLWGAIALGLMEGRLLLCASFVWLGWAKPSRLPLPKDEST